MGNFKLFYDTETSGLPLFSEPSEDPRQPHIVQLAALLVNDDTGDTISSIDIVCRSQGLVIPDDVAKIHGITTEYAMDVGISEQSAVEMLIDMWRNRPRIGHNEQFDARIIRIALKRFSDKDRPFDKNDISDVWKASPAECTARLSTPICKLPPTEKMVAAKRLHHKTPTMTEAYECIIGKKMENAHSAMADVLACKDVYYAIKKESVQ